MQDLDGAGLSSQISRGLMQIMNKEFKGKIQVAEELHEKNGPLMLTRRQIANQIDAFL